MKMAKYILAALVLLTICMVPVNGQANDDSGDKFTSVNVMLSTVYTTKLGMILEYYSSQKIQQTYLPNQFFIDGRALKVYEDNSNLTPQINIIYKNQKPYKVKIYVPSKPYGLTYRTISFITEELRKGFAVSDLKFEF
jgi:hypothetical protein